MGSVKTYPYRGGSIRLGLHLTKAVTKREMASNQLRGASEPGIGVLRVAGIELLINEVVWHKWWGALTHAAGDLGYHDSISPPVLAKRCPVNS